MSRRVLFLGFLLASLVSAIAAPPAWWASRGATDTNPPNDDAALNQGQLKQFTQKAVQELNARIPGGAGPELNGLVTGWVHAYQTGGYNAANPLPADFEAMNSGQLIGIAALVHGRLVNVKYENALPGWIVRNQAKEKQLVNLGQLKTVFNFDLTAPTGQLPEWWQKFHFDGQIGIDPNGDPDGDGINNAQENQLGLDPNSADRIGPVNLGFDEEITDSPDINFRESMIPYPSDVYDQTSIPGYLDSNGYTEGWQADTGSHIEIWDEGVSSSSAQQQQSEVGAQVPTPPSPYVELQSHMEAHGVKQEFNMLPGSRLNFILRYKGRYEFDAYDNAFDLKVEGASELLVDGAPAGATGSSRSKPFMDDDAWDPAIVDGVWQENQKYGDWHHASVSITAESVGSGLKRITLSLVPQTTTTYGDDGVEQITYGGFVDLLPVEVRAFQDVNGPHGSAPMYAPPQPSDGQPFGDLFSAWVNEKITFGIAEPIAGMIARNEFPAGTVKWTADGFPPQNDVNTFDVQWTSSGLKHVNLQIGSATFRLYVNVPNTGTLNYTRDPTQDVDLILNIGLDSYWQIAGSGLTAMNAVKAIYGPSETG